MRYSLPIEVGRTPMAPQLATAGDFPRRVLLAVTGLSPQIVTLGGVVGEWKLAGELGELMPWFWLGQRLHVGKNTTMGMGMYSLSW
jgi:hypothetical protein